MLKQIQTTNTNLPQMGFYGKKTKLQMLTFSKFPQNSRFRLLQILANTNGNSNGNTNADAKTNMNTHSYSNLPQMGPWELRPYRGEGLRSAQCSCCNPPQLFFCEMYLSINIFPWSRRFLFSKIVRKINACIACIRNTVLYDIQCHVNGVVYFCVTCVNASRILGDQHGIVCGIVLYYMYVVLYRTFASIIPAQQQRG